MLKHLPGIILKCGAIIFLLEASIHAFAAGVGLHGILKVLLDASLLSVVSSPLIYFGVLKPYVLEHDRAVAQAVMLSSENDVSLSERRFMDSVINGLPGMFYLLDSEGRLARWNLEFESISGYSATELGNRPALSFFEGEDRERVEQRIRTVFENGSSSVEAEFVTRDGRRIPYYFNGHRIHLGGQPYITGLGIDISDSRRMTEALRKSERHFATLLSVSPVGLFETDRDGKCVYINKRYEEITGQTFESALNRGWEHALHPDDREMVLHAWIAAKSARKPFYLEYRLLDDAGGVTWVFGCAEPFYSDSGEWMGYIGTVMDITEKKNSEDVMWRQANFDLLTGLPNRMLLLDRLSKALSQARRSGRHVALIYLDLDGFKPVNDCFGHLSGDIVLKRLAQRWQSCVREMDTVARVGGDEFAVVLGELDDFAEASRVAEKLLQASSQAIALPDGRECHVGASAGISIYPANGAEIDSLLAAADFAMYESKSRGRNIYTVFGTGQVKGMENDDWIVFSDAYLVGVPEIDEQHRELVRMVNRINLALRGNEKDEVVSLMLDKMIEFVLSHFETEHRLMERHHYPDMEAHDREHARLLEEMHEITSRFGQGSELLVLQSVKDWMLNHIGTEDKYLGAWLAGHAHMEKWSVPGSGKSLREAPAAAMQ